MLKYKTKENIYSILAVALIVLFFIFINKSDSNKRSLPEQVNSQGVAQLHIIDVGQGDSALLVSPDCSMLIDAGPGSNEQDLMYYLDLYGIKKLDALVLSHPHEDHIGGADLVLENLTVEKIIMPNAYSSTKAFNDVLDIAEEQNILTEIAAAGDRFEIGSAIFTILSPDEGEHNDDLNNASIVMRVDIEKTALMFTGDAEAEVEAEILEGFDKKLLDCDYLKVGHHGSSTSSTEKFVKAVSPRFASISCEADNDYGHPHRETTELLEKLNIVTDRTDIDSSIVYEIDNGVIERK